MTAGAPAFMSVFQPIGTVIKITTPSIKDTSWKLHRPLSAYHWPKLNVMVTLAARETGRCNLSFGQSWSQLTNGYSIIKEEGAYSLIEILFLSPVEILCCSI